ncbi:MAG TPA: fimbria/pilus outer membrane usher protein [Lysobacter sp.]|nr:fimbria/pilus outer membrane usher protein [Lysobacter sp.]
MSRLCLALALASLLAAGAVSAAPREDWYRAALNHRETGLGVLIVTRDDGSRWIRITDLRLLGLPVPAAVPQFHAGERIVPLSALAAESAIDAAGKRLHLFDHAAVPAETGEELILDIVVNGRTLAEAQIVRQRDGALLLSRETAAAARFAVTEGVHGDWIPLAALAGRFHVLDMQRMRLEISAAPERFETTRLRLPGAQPDAGPVASAPSAVIGYDLNSGRTAQGASWFSVLVDAAASSGRATCRTRHLWHSERSASRLDSHCTLDWPERRLSLVLGDAVSRGGALSHPVRYGGVRLGTDFALQPHLNTQPLLAIEGSARLPSTLEIWLDQQLAHRTDVLPGGFLLEGIPALAGRGDIHAVVTDALGRRTLLSAPFYSDPRLLQPGLMDWAVEAGRLRHGFLTSDEHYGAPFALVSWRGGVTSYWTLEGRAEWTPAHRLTGVTQLVNLAHHGIVELALTHTQSDAGDALAYAVGYSYQGRRWNAGLRLARYDAAYVDLAHPEPGDAPALDAQVNLGLRIGRASFSAGAVRREHHGDAAPQSMLRASATLPLSRSYLTLSVLRIVEPVEDSVASLLYTLPLSGARSLSAWADRSGGSVHPGLSLQRSLPAGTGAGYRISWDRGAGGGRTALAGAYRGRAGQIDASLFDTPEGTEAWLGMRGALLANGRGVFVAPDDGGSFAVVSLPQAGVEVLRDHQRVAQTNADGHAVVAGLRPFERNRLGIVAESLAASSRVDRTALELRTGRRQVVSADFGGRRVVARELRVVRPDGMPVPAGADARSPGAEDAVVGYDGLLYLERLSPEPRDITVAWPGGGCSVDVASQAAAPAAGQVHEVVCR